MDALIKFKNLKKAFGKRVILNNIGLEIAKGEIVGIIGMSGSGKTTFLNTLIGFLEPEQGDILFWSEWDGCYKSVFKNKTEICSTFGYATQVPSFYPKLTIKENLEHFGILHRLSEHVRETNIQRLLELTGLTHYKDELAQNLSEGMKKRLDIACALVHNPHVLLLDEPTADLDPVLRKEIWRLVQGIHKMGTTIIIASHLLAELEQICTKIGILHNAQLTATATPAQLKARYAGISNIHLETTPGNYNLFAQSLAKFPQLKIEKIAIQGSALTIRTPYPQAVLHHIFHLLEQTREKLINAHITQPSLAEIFEAIAKS